MTHHLENILARIEQGLRFFEPPAVEPMQGDQWLLASAMQKAIRRGEVKTALRAGYALWNIDRQRFWRRLHIIALEDTGIADTESLIQTLTATAQPYWRRKFGDLRVGLYLTQLLCQCVKTRIADSLFIQAERSPAYVALRDELINAPTDDLADRVMDEAASLVERAIAIWFLAGTKKYPSDHLPVRVGDPDYVMAVLRRLNVPPDLTHACIGVMTRTSWPLAIMAPLIWQYVEGQRTEAIIREAEIAPAQEVEGIPLYAMDMFTRSGQASFRQWQKEIPALRYFSVRQIGIAMFYEESHLTDKALTTPAMDKFMDEGQWVDAESTGLCLPEYFALRDLVREHFPVLQKVRVRQLRRVLDGADA
ncbi:MAG: hypothetical protein DI626_01265 [Micavibrio aeruginosavorus]|uniref:Uncharacterized protein n=1 Tax=Micavibrio aeruginosavorus TaxID=349221 RepID=A0A2W5A641_9BACT|nr:MAG: hypothetical protein DI626_01265 [Micavibrio aeruginosavorus]